MPLPHLKPFAGSPPPWGWSLILTVVPRVSLMTTRSPLAPLPTAWWPRKLLRALKRPHPLLSLGLPGVFPSPRNTAGLANSSSTLSVHLAVAGPFLIPSPALTPQLGAPPRYARAACYLWLGRDHSYFSIAVFPSMKNSTWHVVNIQGLFA